ncbi:MAG: extracellular solute-binding protein [Clostridia bacterium]|nr:extracellular solute-binding protein [Clostridia bacterium]NCC44243.1 extracellular solute-binding protein [Clostridia bacterium]
MKKKQVLSLMLASVMVFSMAACGNSSAPADDTAAKDDAAATTEDDAAATDDAASGEKQKITITWRDDGTDINLNANYIALNAAYEAWDKKDQVELDFAPITASEGDYFTKIALQLADPSTCPDLVCEDTFQLPNDVSAGYLTNLDSYVADYEDWNNGLYFESMQSAVTGADGSVYGIPYCTDTRGIFYNREIMTEAGVIAEGEDFEPKTWQDILDACQKVKDNCPDVVPFWCNSGVATGEATSMQTYEMLLYGTGERLIGDDGKWIVNSDGIKDSLQFLSDIYTNGYGPSLSLVLNGQASNTSAKEYMPEGKLAMSMDGIWITGNWKDTGASPWEGYADKVGLAPMPTSEGQDPGSVTLAGGWAYSIPENSDQKDITWEFIKQVMSPEFYLQYIMQAGNIAVRTDTAEEAEYTAQPLFGIATQFLETADFRPQNDQYSTVSTSIQKMVESVVSGTSPEDAMKQYGTDVARDVGDENVAQ